ncbi:hypothetical protein HFO24_06700 [Rhizobium laguerreae]|uniref:hypothetical protein n=1 Tax=Rhizobium laguerreae TaxID=1076926 RepID=UPI001C919663|nr:hypothetical protein [Rhizobium laguerreae]MBY3181359.1 hypothetical protein [Rhizobium laguerreae]
MRVALVLTFISVAAFGAEADTFVTRDCSPILNQVKANTINLNIKCDPKTELQLVQEVVAGAWKESCHFRTLTTWYSHYDDANSTLETTPKGDSYFSRFNFTAKLSFSSRTYSEAAELEEEKELEAELAKNPKAVEDEAEVRDDYDAPSVKEQLASAVGTFVLRVFLIYEDGSGLAEGDVTIFKDQKNKRLSSAMSVEEVLNAYPSDGDAIPSAAMSCGASDEMNVVTFKALCKAVIEQSTMDETFDFKCGSGDDEPN